MLIYKIVFKLDNKSYIGWYSKCNSDEEFQKSNYWGSGKYIKKAIKYHGKENFERKTLLRGIKTLEELFFWERFYIGVKNTKYPNGYNLTDGGEGLLNPSDEIREKKIKGINRFLLTPEGNKWKKEQSKRLNNFFQTIEGEKRRREQSKRKKDFYQTSEGEKRAKEQSEELKKFHQTPEGDKWRKDQSKRKKDFYQTLEGKKWRKKLSEKQTGDKNPTAREVVLISPDGVPIK